VLELSVESSTLGADIDIAGQNLPSFGSRKIETKIRLRDGESTLLAGLLREDERRALKGVMGLIHLPVFRSLFSSNDNSMGQTDIVMIITPHVVRTHELRQQDVNPIHIGTQQHLGLGGPPPLIAPQTPTPAEPQPQGPLAAPRPAEQQPPRPITGTSQPGPVPGTMAAPGVVPQAPAQAPAPQPPATEPAPPLPEPVPDAQAAQAAAPQTAQGVARLLVTPPGSELGLTGGPYTVPVSLANAPRVSAVSVSVVFDPAVVHVRSVQEGSFMRQGGVSATFTREIDNNGGRVDISIVRGDDPVGASGTGLLAAIMIEPVAAGTATFSVSGAGTGPAGSTVTLGSTPVTVTVR
jgi:general secretion pathway protein D